MADMKKVYDDLIIINLYLKQSQIFGPSYFDRALDSSAFYNKFYPAS